MPAGAYHQRLGPFTAAELAEKLGLDLQGDPAQSLLDVLPITQAGPEHLSFLDNPKYKSEAAKTQAGAVVIHPDNADVLPASCAALLSQQPYADYARALNLFYPARIEAGVHPTATVDPTAEVVASSVIGPGAVIGAGVKIGENCQIGANAVIQCAQVGNHVIIHPNVSIGQDGFGFAPTPTGALKVPQVGGVVIEDHVEIGANTTIDRGALDDTVIGAGTKIDNLVQIAHNVRIGRSCMIVAQAGIAGSTTLGDGVIVGGQSGLAGHIKVASGTQIAARSGVTKTFSEPGQTLGGFPAMPIQQWRRLQGALLRLSRKDKRK